MCVFLSRALLYLLKEKEAEIKRMLDQSTVLSSVCHETAVETTRGSVERRLLGTETPRRVHETLRIA